MIPIWSLARRPLVPLICSIFIDIDDNDNGYDVEQKPSVYLIWLIVQFQI